IMDEDNRRLAPVRQSLTRQATVFGAERTPMLLMLLLGLLPMLTGTTLVTTIIGLVILIVGVGGLRMAAREHPRATEVYRRAIRQRAFYPARRRYRASYPYSVVIRRSHRRAQ
ncbi:MAG: hypothetical protein HKN42_01470, partial [Granulosicoccus sp.]|nr:hypothetical protein [Granulosicoccus sp.]